MPDQRRLARARSVRIDAGLGTVLLIVVFNGLSTAIPVPGGAGSQQVLATYALHGVISTAAAVSFSIGLQVGTTVLNTTIGLLATMLLFRTLRAARRSSSRTCPVLSLTPHLIPQRRRCQCLEAGRRTAAIAAGPERAWSS